MGLIFADLIPTGMPMNAKSKCPVWPWSLTSVPETPTPCWASQRKHSMSIPQAINLRDSSPPPARHLSHCRLTRGRCLVRLAAGQIWESPLSIPLLSLKTASALPPEYSVNLAKLAVSTMSTPNQCTCLLTSLLALFSHVRWPPISHYPFPTPKPEWSS